MFGIALFYRPVNEFLRKITRADRAPRYLSRVVKRVNTGVTLYVCVTVATLPLCIQYFGYIATYGLFANLILLPILVLAFQLSIVAVTTWVGGVLLFVVNPLISIVIFAAGAMSNFWGAQIFLANSGALNIAWWAGLMFLSRFIFLSRRIKYTIAGALLLVYTFSFFV
jgi:predicted membrane metal-binding protein